MKRCPTCNRSYVDDTQKFCLEDGATLVGVSAPSFDPQATLAMPGAQPTSPPSSPYGSGSGQGSSGAGAAPGSFGSGSAQGQPAGSWSPTPSRFTPVVAAQAKKSMLPWILGGAAVLVVGLIGLVIIIAIAVNSTSNKNSNTSTTSNTSNTSNSNRSKSASTDIVLKSSDGKIQVSTPPSWKIVTDLNDKADLQVSNSGESMYLIVLTDNKADYTNMDIDQHATKTLQTLTTAMTSSNTSDPVRLTIDGNPAVQHEVRGEIKNLNVIYIHTTVETPTSYQQIVVVDIAVHLF